MRVYDIIEKKRDNKNLNEEEIKYIIKEYVSGKIPDYQMSAFLMAVYFNGMNEEECFNFAKSMLNSGEKMDLTSIPGIKVDKHSTGGVGDKTTLIVVPIVAACGVKVAKMSGRGLGYTGGTVDKLESIPGMNVSLSMEKFFEIVKNVGCSVVSQTGNLVPADKKIYALRDVTATVESKPLVASSIMSKKIASGADCILLDVKTGKGAFMKTLDDAVELSEIMVKIGENFGRKVMAVITDMDAPLGNAVGNSLEVWESCEVLKGGGPEDLKEVSVYLAANMLYMAGKGTLKECITLVNEVINNGKAYEKFKEMISTQGGDLSSFDNFDTLEKDDVCYEIVSEKEGYISSIDAEKLGKASMVLGVGRLKKEDSIDYKAGIILSKKIGDKVEKGDVLAALYSSKTEKCKCAEEIIKESVVLSYEKVKAAPLIHAKVTDQGVEKF
ncbi:MAG: pyrimidine-nucleoside phosphorylase [Clostridia bacterium]|nr:pyrimidine-nucleoside phosphorylase [Clostridia bacterium]